MADRLEEMAPEMYFQPVDGDPELERLSHGVDELLAKLDACEKTGGDSRLCTPFFSEIERALDQHKHC